MRKSFSWITCILLLVSFCFISQANLEEVCKFEYLGMPHDFNDSTIIVPENMVAMSEYVHIGQPFNIITEGNPCSIMLVVDVSASNSETDQAGVRFEVLRDVLDSIYNRNSKVKVGMIYLSSELYFKPADDQLFSGVSSGIYKGGYIPLLTLDETYSGSFTETDGSGNVQSRTPYTKSGVNVLKMYLETTQGTFKMIPEYEPSYELEIGTWQADFPGARPLTNITASFDGAKDALNKSPHAKSKHYIIFLSDGYATEPTLDAAERDRYIQGTNVPTTFTVFYNPSSNDLARLQQMTANIKANGYSTSNQLLTNIWDMTMDHDALLKLLVDNVISQIITNIVTFETQDVQVNGLGPVTGWDSTGFFFQNFFPLLGVETDFHYEIDYKITKDSILENGDTVTVYEKDTTHIIDYTVEIVDGSVMPDSFITTCWGRKLEFYDNGTLIATADDDMPNLEIRFTEYEVDTLYGYEDVEVDITHTGGTSQDLETFKLTDNGTHWSYTFPRVVGNPNSGDGTLQHQNPDSIVAVFRNPALPLDTLRYAIPYLEGYFFNLHTGIYFDNDANGHVDSIYLGISGKKLSENVDDVMDNIELPAHRNFTVDNYAAVSGGIALNVTEKAPAILTYVTADDIIETDSVVLNGDAVLLPGKIDIIDSMAPIIMSATLMDSVKIGARDELSVTFSEGVATITEDKPFKYYSIVDTKVYDATLGVLSQNATVGVFEVKSVDGVTAILHGDSIRITYSLADNVRDALGNKQDNPGNIRREIEVINVEEGLKVTKAFYFDNTANGHVDSIFIQVYGEIQDYIDDLMKAITLPPHRDFLVQGSSYSNGGIAVDVLERSSTVRTYVTEEDSIKVLTKIVLPDSMIILTAGVAVIDSMAPIIMTATMVDSIIVISIGQTDSLTTLGRDELTIIFSENIEALTYTDPFKFYCTTQQQKYDAILKLVSQNANQGVFTVESLSGVSRITDGDSIRINWNYGDNVYDALPNNQDNPKNIRRPINLQVITDTIYVQAQFDLVLKSTILDLNKEGIMVITLDPDPIENVSDNDRYEGWLNIFDAVGNEIIRDRPMEYDAANKRLIYFWDGRNENQNRIVGAGAYKAIVPVDIYFVDEKRTVVKQATVGVKD